MARVATKEPTSREQRRQETFARVFEAALQEFHRVGVEKARVSDVCRAAGVAKGTFFFHFATKDDVLLERQRLISQAMAARIERELDGVDDVALFVERLIAIVVEEHMAVGDPALVREINLAIVRRAGAPKLGAQHTAFGNALAVRIGHLQAAGVLRHDLVPMQLADCLRLSFFGFLVDPQFLQRDGRSRLQMLATLLMDALVDRKGGQGGH